MSPVDDRWMLEALALAQWGRGFVEPNPMVGCMIVDADGHKVGEGYHERFGGNHAEVNALRQAGERAHGGTLYVTLEPCCHHGKTPPCTDAILKAGIAHVVAAMSDPFPQVAGGGLATLKAAGVAVTVGVCETQAKALNAPYLKLLATGMPWVHAKWAMTLDGKIATRTGESKWISNDASRRKVHELRGRMDAIIIGRGTLLADDPLLTARPPGPWTATRVIVTASGQLPMDRQLLHTASDVPVLIYTGNATTLKPWADAGAEIMTQPMNHGMLSPEFILKDLGQRRFTNILLEGGPGLLGRFHDANAIDEVHAFIAPKLFGGTLAPGPVGGFGLANIGDARRLELLAVEMLDGDVYLNGRIQPRAPA
ncbi:bifunctional diaminohydroxyphosphoribosylaminopyrimidine deaminase/5-amino-6-(5-phosphoribosylamino)uracil reductase RibD [soil metagenome]